MNISKTGRGRKIPEERRRGEDQGGGMREGRGAGLSLPGEKGRNQGARMRE